MLDLVFIPPGCHRVHSGVIRTLLSDHLPVVLDLAID
jgi:hypothetical protein